MECSVEALTFTFIAPVYNAQNSRCFSTIPKKQQQSEKLPSFYRLQGMDKLLNAIDSILNSPENDDNTEQEQLITNAIKQIESVHPLIIRFAGGKALQTLHQRSTTQHKGVLYAKERITPLIKGHESSLSASVAALVLFHDHDHQYRHTTKLHVKQLLHPDGTLVLQHACDEWLLWLWWRLWQYDAFGEHVDQHLLVYIVHAMISFYDG